MSPPTVSRRTIITGTTHSLLATTGCLFGASTRGEAESLSGQIANETSTAQAVTVRLTAFDGTVDFDQLYEISSDDAVDFQLENPATQYTLITETESGASKSVEWDVTPCSSYIHIGIYPDRIDYNFGAC